MFFVIAPAIGWTWPALWPIATAAAAGLGYKVSSKPKGIFRGATSNKLDQLRRVSVPLDKDLAEVVAEEMGREERIQFEKDDMTLVFRKDARGKFFVEVAGPAEKTTLDLRIRAEEFAVEVVRKFAYHKLAEQLQRSGSTIYEEKVEEDGRITMKGRRWK
jgi:hypothetical protein